MCTSLKIFDYQNSSAMLWILSVEYSAHETEINGNTRGMVGNNAFLQTSSQRIIESVVPVMRREVRYIRAD